MSHTTRRRRFDLRLHGHSHRHGLVGGVRGALGGIRSRSFNCYRSYNIRVNVHHLRTHPATSLYVSYGALTRVHRGRVTNWLRPFRRICREQRVLPPCFLFGRVASARCVNHFTPSPSNRLRFNSLVTTLNDCLRTHTQRNH